MGLWARQRASDDLAGLIHHSDRGVQYRAICYIERLADAEAAAPVGSKGDSDDNAMAEALNSLFKAECIRNSVMRPRGGWKSRQPSSRPPRRASQPVEHYRQKPVLTEVGSN